MRTEKWFCKVRKKNSCDLSVGEASGPSLKLAVMENGWAARLLPKNCCPSLTQTGAHASYRPCDKRSLLSAETISKKKKAARRQNNVCLCIFIWVYILCIFPIHANVCECYTCYKLHPYFWCFAGVVDNRWRDKAAANRPMYSPIRERRPLRATCVSEHPSSLASILGDLDTQHNPPCLSNPTAIRVMRATA